MLQKRKRVPNLTVEDFEGKKTSLWDYRQKGHLIVIYDPQASEAARAQWSALLKADAPKWDWLRATFVFAAQAPAEMNPGVYFVDRWGVFWDVYPLNGWSFESLEKELIYYEARHC